MTAQETNLLNAFETTLTGTIGASDLTMTVNSVVDSASNTLAAPCYLVLNPDSATNREVVLVTSINSGTKTLTLDNINKRYLTGSAATSGLSHASGSVVRMSPLQQHIEDINDRVDTVINAAGTALNTTLFLDEDDMTSNSATKGVTQQSVKAYVDTQLTAEDLDISADSGSNIAIDLDSEVLDLEGGTGIDTTTGTNKVTFAVDSTIATLSGTQALTNKTIDVDSNTVSNIEVDNLKSGVLDTDISSTAGTDTTIPSAKAVKTYVDAQTTAQDLDITDGSTTSAVDLDSQTMTIQGTSNEVEVGLSGQAFTIGLPATITANVTGNVSGTSGSTTGNAATATALQTARNIGGVSFDGTGNIDLPGVNTAGNQNTSGTAADLSATLDETKGGTGLTSFTTGDILYASGSNTLAKLSIGSSGQTLQVSSGGIVEWATATTGDITGVTAGTGLSGGGTSGTVTLNVDSLAVAQGGTGATSFADKSVIITQDSGTDTLAAVAMDADGELLIGGTSGPAVATLTAGTGVTITNADGAITIAAPDVGDITGVTAGTGLSGGGTTGAVTLNVETSQNITALTGGDLTIYEDANNADVSLKMGTSATESLTIEVLNGGSNKTAEQINFTTATASGTADHGKMVFNVDETTIATIDDGGIDLASGLEFSVNGTAIGGSAGALIDGDSDFTLTDGVASGIHYELDNTDMADWNQAGVVLTTAGGIFQHHQTQAATYSVPANTGAVLAGPITITGTITNNGTMVVI
jgi:hypothetical protein